MKDFYYILGAASNATSNEIDEAYQKLAHKFYPSEDEHDDFLDEHLREITEAYDILRDTRRRRVYDAALRRNQKKQLAAFRTRYLNVGITIMFLVVTVLFADYVIRTLRGHPLKKASIQKPAPQPAAAAAVATPHIKKHHHAARQIASLAGSKPAADGTSERQSPASPASVGLIKMPADSSVVILHANITGIIYLHGQPDYNSEVIAKIPDGAKVHVLHRGSSWCKIAFNDQTGYVIRAIVEGK